MAVQIIALVSLLLVVACQPTLKNQSQEAPEQKSDWTGVGRSGSLPGGLSTKLDDHFQRFLLTRTMLRKWVTKGEVVSREKLEAYLSKDGEITFSDQELRTIKSYQNSLIADAKMRAKQDSIIDLTPIRHEQSAEFCKALPKGGMLHLHPWGTVSRKTARRIMNDFDPKISAKSLAKKLKPASEKPSILLPSEINVLSNIQDGPYSGLSSTQKSRFENLMFMPTSFPSAFKSDIFRRFLGAFTVIGKTLIQRDTEMIMWNDLFERAKEQRLSYMEITVTPPYWESGWAKNWEPKLREIYNLARSKNLHVRFLAGFNRARSDKKNFNQILKPIMENLADFDKLVGINLQGDETNNSALEKAQIIYTHRDPERWRATQHAGELGNAQNVRDAILLGADRVGHGVRVMAKRSEVVTLQHMRRLITVNGVDGFPVEVNILSNIKLGVSKIEKHPFLDFLRLGLPISFSTDDEGIFETTQSAECEIAVNESDIQYSELKRIMENSLRTAFMPEHLKTDLLQQLRSDFSQFESQWCQREDAVCSL